MTIVLDYAGTAGEQIELLYRAHRRPLMSYLARLTGDRETAEDLCQETFLKAIRSWAQHDPHSSAVHWLYRIATNTAYDNLRRRKIVRWTSLDNRDNRTRFDVAAEDHLFDRAALRSALARLPPADRVPILMASDGYTTSEMAETLKCSAPAVRMRLHRARTRLREIHGDEP